MSYGPRVLIALFVFTCLVAVELISTYGEVRQLRKTPRTVDLTETIGRRQ